MRLKTTPEDFEVREATSLRIKRQPAPYRVYLLEKRDFNTTDALQQIARSHRVPYTAFAYGGRKDRHAVTYQYVTFYGRKDVATEAKSFKLKALGYADEPMAPRLILTNTFTLTIRELESQAAQHLKSRLPQIEANGFINYFDDQRFGGFSGEQGFIGEHLLLGDWEAALRQAITAIHPEDKREAKERKRALADAWGNWGHCRSLATAALEQRAFTALEDGASGQPHAVAGICKQVLTTVQPEAINMWISTYQSYLWNEWVRRLITGTGGETREVPGAAGPYVFPTQPRPEWRELKLPLPGKGMRFDSPALKALFTQILAKRGVPLAALEHGEVLPKLAFKASPREMTILPPGVHAEGPMPDDRYPGKEKLTLSFSLPKGVYATMLVKALQS